jgi:hypothetical protein
VKQAQLDWQHILKFGIAHCIKSSEAKRTKNVSSKMTGSLTVMTLGEMVNLQKDNLSMK